MKSFLSNLQDLGLPRLAALGCVGVAMLAMLGIFAFHSSQQPMALLYRDLDPKEAGEIVEQLDKSHIPHTVSQAGDTVSVPGDQVAGARLLLAKAGLPSGGSVGYEIFDRAGSLTSTQFEQSINETRALEGELERSIRLIRGVKGARVHLVLPHRELFSTQEQSAQASVLLAMAGTSRLDNEATQAVLNLVSAAVPSLKPQNIAIVDTHGNVLARAGTPSDESEIVQTAEEQRQNMELRLSRAVEDILERTVGPDHVRVETSVTMNFDRVNETQEKYDPDQQVLRSQQTHSDKSINTEAPQNVSVSNNLPNANAGAPQSSNQDTRQDETNNYEIGKTVRTLVQDRPRVARVSVAVMVDGVIQSGKDGKPVWAARSADELERLTTLTKSAIGFDAARGDTVNVVSMRFNTEELAPETESSGWFGMHFEHNDVMQIARSIIFGVFLLLIVIFAVRPVLAANAKKAENGAEVGKIGISGGQPSLSSGSSQALVATSAGTGLALVKPDGTRAGNGDEELVDVSGVDGSVRASSIRKIVGIVEENTEESIAIIRAWLSAEQEAR